MHRINMLRFNNVVPVVVFDGGHLPLKASTETERQRRRDSNFEQARAKLSEGDVAGANELYQRAVEVTPMMAYELITVLKAHAVEFVVAPYEADAQLAQLSNLDPERGGVAAVISEDSDLLAYGCNVVIYKMDRYGNGEEIVLADILKAERKPAGCDLSFRCFTKELFTGMCVLAGCDFLPSVPGIGVKRAHGLVSKYRNLPRVLASMRFDTKIAVPEGYGEGFRQANAIFHHARVYDPSSRRLSFLSPLPAQLLEELNGDIDFLGPDLPPSRAIAIAEGRLDPISMCAFDEFPRGNCFPPAKIPPLKSHHSSLSLPLSTPPPIDEGDVWVGTDDELLAMLAVKDLDEQSTGVSARSFLGSGLPPSSLRPDKAFIAHLQLVSSNPTRRPESVLQHQEPWLQDAQSQTSLRSESSIVESSGQKRVFPPVPINNPFKKKRLTASASFPEDRNGLSLGSQLHGALFSKAESRHFGGSLAETTSTSFDGKELFSASDQPMQFPDSIDCSTVMAFDFHDTSQAENSKSCLEAADSQCRSPRQHYPGLESLISDEMTEEDATAQKLSRSTQAQELESRDSDGVSMVAESTVSKIISIERSDTAAGSRLPAEDLGNLSRSVKMTMTQKKQRETIPQTAKSSESAKSSRSKQSKVLLASVGCSRPGLLKFFKRASTH